MVVGMGWSEIGWLEATARPRTSFGRKELCPNVFLKAGALLHSPIRNHAFVDGNKRVAVLSAATFLEGHDYRLTTTNQALEKFALNVVEKKWEVEKVAHWLEEHTSKK
ncbi:type II toxin-antitoxin system death-on-curing family toxin [Candidatus Parcubacteria bacterium]|nr:type II toxin-antitoxin system death-on-curing family toxin [Candidatus Parcubacteria bacterium]